MSTVAWRRLLLGLCALGLILTGTAVWITTHTLAEDPGVTIVTAVPFSVVKSNGEAPFITRIVAPPGSEAYRQGLRSGDLLDLRRLAATERYRWISYFRLADQRLDLPVERDGKVRHISFVTPHVTIVWDAWLAYLGFAWALMFAGVIAWRRSDSKEARILSLLLSTAIISYCIYPWNWVTRWPALDATAAFISSMLYGLSSALLATYAMTFSPPANPLRRVLMWLSYISAAAMPIYGLAYIVGAWSATADPRQAWYAGPLSQLIVAVSPFIFPLLCAIATIVQTRGTDRARLVWATAALSILYLSNAVIGLTVSLNAPVDYNVEFLLANVSIFLVPIGLTYVVLNRRVLDIGFALNRALVFSAVSLIFLGGFLLVEWALGAWLSTASHATNLVVSGAIALALGFSMRSIHHRVDRILDTIFFRKRHDDERAIRNFSHEAAYITDATVLRARTETMLEEHADASSVAILLDDDHGRYGEASENDPAIVSLRAWGKVVDLHAIDTILHGEFAYPMVARGHLVGAIVLGPKRSGDPYAPDESNAILHLAHGVGAALDVLSANGRASSDGLLAALQTMSGDFKALAYEVHALRQRSN